MDGFKRIVYIFGVILVIGLLLGIVITYQVNKNDDDTFIEKPELNYEQYFYDWDYGMVDLKVNWQLGSYSYDISYNDSYDYYMNKSYDSKYTDWSTNNDYLELNNNGKTKIYLPRYVDFNMDGVYNGEEHIKDYQIVVIDYDNRTTYIS